MCLLTYIPGHVEPDVESLLIGASNNPDGHGFAMITGDRIVVHKSMSDPDALIEQFLTLRETFPDGHALFHSRIATAGIHDVSNCHPFRVGNDKRTVLAHNGILPRKSQPRTGDIRSDTRLFAEVWLPKGRFGHIRNNRGRKHLERWLGAGNKMVILNVNPKIRERVIILNAQLGEWFKGSWYSNDSYEYRWPKYTYYSSTRYTVPRKHYNRETQRWEDIETADGILGYPPIEHGIRPDDPMDMETEAALFRAHCEYCGARYSVDVVTEICRLCRSCQDCGQWETDCLCWVSDRKDAEPDSDNLSVADVVRDALRRAQQQQ